MPGQLSKKLLWILAAIVVAVYALLPFAWIISLSLKQPADLTDARFIPRSVTWDNYSNIFDQSVFTSALRNSIGIALLSTVIAVLLATTAAYAIARLDFPASGSCSAPPSPSPSSLRSRSSVRCSRSGVASACTTRGSG
jgi:multiple sugar transport system permease protein